MNTKKNVIEIFYSNDDEPEDFCVNVVEDAKDYILGRVFSELDPECYDTYMQEIDNTVYMVHTGEVGGEDILCYTVYHTSEHLDVI